MDTQINLQLAVDLIQQLRDVIERTSIGTHDNGVVEDCDVKYTLESIQGIIENELEECIKAKVEQYTKEQQ